MNEPYKMEILESIKVEPITIYHIGEAFLCMLTMNFCLFSNFPVFSILNEFGCLYLDLVNNFNYLLSRE